MIYYLLIVCGIWGIWFIIRIFIRYSWRIGHSWRIYSWGIGGVGKSGQLENRRSWRIGAVGESAQLENRRSWRIFPIPILPGAVGEFSWRSWNSRDTFSGPLGASAHLEKIHSWRISPTVNFLQLQVFSNCHFISTEDDPCGHTPQIFPNFLHSAICNFPGRLFWGVTFLLLRNRKL